MKLIVTGVDYNPPELNDQVPFSFTIIRMLPGPDRPDYWLGKLDVPLRWINDNHEQEIDHVAVCARWQGTQIALHVSNIPIGIAYITDPSQLHEASLSFDKCRYVAIGVASEVESGSPPVGLASIISGRIRRAFGLGKGE